jgi:hypothetical protein
MHGGDVHGQIEPAMRGNQACLQCHAAIGRDVSAHTKHATASSGSTCMECHMPRIVYGVLEIHRSHRIESPDARRDAEAGRPNACTLCHLDRSPLWTARTMDRLWGPGYAEPRSRADEAPLELPDAVASILAGDPLQRAVYARALGRADAPLDPHDKAFLRAHLAVTMGDGYPSIRWLAQNSLAALERELPLDLGGAIAAIDHTSSADERRADVLGLIRLVAASSRSKLHPPRSGQLLRPDFTPELETIIQLTNQQAARSISIGE